MTTLPTLSARNGTDGHVNGHKTSYRQLLREFERGRQELINEWRGLLDAYRAGLNLETYSTGEEDIWNRFYSLRDTYRGLGLRV